MKSEDRVLMERLIGYARGYLNDIETNTRQLGNVVKDGSKEYDAITGHMVDSVELLSLVMSGIKEEVKKADK